MDHRGGDACSFGAVADFLGAEAGSIPSDRRHLRRGCNAGDREENGRGGRGDVEDLESVDVVGVFAAVY